MMDVQIERVYFYDAEKSYKAKQYNESKKIYQSLLHAHEKNIRAISMLRLGEIANAQGKPLAARNLILKAFMDYPTLAFNITSATHPSHDYVFPGMQDEVEVTCCPLCGKPGKAYWSYNMVDYNDFDRRFNPVRTWMHCEACHHLYASSYAEQSHIGHDNAHNKAIASVLPFLFSSYSILLGKLKQLTRGNRLLEVGVGNGELIAAAHEMAFDAIGVDISIDNVEHAKEIFGVNVVCTDFMRYDSEEPFDFVCMGDVLEHLANPRAAIKKVNGLLVPNGILWVSTPNFEGAYSKHNGHLDPMKKVSDHLNYFSYQSLKMLLEQEGFDLLQYQISSHYYGSMEIIARKKQDCAPGTSMG